MTDTGTAVSGRRITVFLRAGVAYGLACFALLAAWCLSGASRSVDSAVTAWAVASRATWLTDLAWPITDAGGTVGLTIATVVVALALAWYDRRHWAALSLSWRHWWDRSAYLLVSMLSSAVVTSVIKLVFQRQRPSVHLLLGAPASSYSFPSGHSFNTGVFAFTLAALVLVSRRALGWKVTAFALAMVATVAVGGTRIYLAYHWFTDVAAGWSLALAWVCAGALLLRSSWRLSQHSAA